MPWMKWNEMKFQNDLSNSLLIYRPWGRLCSMLGVLAIVLLAQTADLARHAGDGDNKPSGGR